MTTAQQLDDADRRRQPITDRSDAIETIDEAYRRQDEYLRLRSVRTGSKVVGYKAALTNEKPRIALGSVTPASGAYLVGDIVRSGAQVPLSNFFAPIMEVELIFRIREDLPSGVSLDQVIATTEVTAGIEVPDSRFDNWFGGVYPSLRLTDVVGDNCLAGGLVVGGTWTPTGLVDFSQVTAELLHDGVVVRVGSATEVEPTPPHIVQWLAEHLAERGKRLVAGDLVSTGTLTETIVSELGHYSARFNSGLGAADITFEV